MNTNEIARKLEIFWIEIRERKQSGAFEFIELLSRLSNEDLERLSYSACCFMELEEQKGGH